MLKYLTIPNNYDTLCAQEDCKKTQRGIKMSKKETAIEAVKTTKKAVGIAKETKKTVKKVKRFHKWILPILVLAVTVGVEMVHFHQEGNHFVSWILFGVCSFLTVLFLILFIGWIFSLVRGWKKRLK